jgi:hypothetical protein
LGDTLDAAPRSGLARPDLITKPASILRGRRSRKCQPRVTAAAALPRDRRSGSLLSYVWALRVGADPMRPTPPRPFVPSPPAWNEGWGSVFSDQALRRDACSAPFRRLAELVGFGNRGMRDCATPNSTRFPWANDPR